MIPDKAVEAAAAAIQVRLARNIGLNDLARAILEAGAPHMLRQAWAEGFKQGGPMHDEHYGEPDKHTVNPYAA